MKRRTAFTLAEVLITLVIIGIIAAMTIPSLLNNTNKQEFRTALKKSISVLNQAITMHYALEGMTVADYTSPADLSSSLFQKRLNVVSTAASTIVYKGSGTSTFYTADGVAYSIGPKAACSQDGKQKCFDVYVDVNGDRKPNIATTAQADPKDGYLVHLYSQRATAGNAVTQAILYDSGLYYD